MDGTSGGNSLSELRSFILLRAVVGSRAYGLEHEASDIDRRGLYAAPAEMVWGFDGPPEQIEDAQGQECYWEARKFFLLALKGNPNVLECLFSPLMEFVAPLAEPVLEQRSMFLSQMLYHSWNGSIQAQVRRTENALKAGRAYRWKAAMHLIRLLHSGIGALRSGRLEVGAGEHREELLAIRRGEWAWKEVERRRLGLQREFDAALASTPLPVAPDRVAAERLLIEIRRQMAR